MEDANHVDLSSLEDAGRDGTQHIFLTVELQRVTSVGTALESCYHIVARGQHVDHLAFSFIAPLESQQNVNLSFVHS